MRSRMEICSAGFLVLPTRSTLYEIPVHVELVHVHPLAGDQLCILEGADRSF